MKTISLLQTLRTRLLQLAFLALLLSCALGINYLSAWSGPPSGTPPNCPSGQVGCDAPINVGGTFQGKTGALSLGSTLDVQTGITIGGIPASPQYTIDMGAMTPGAQNGIRFPDDSVQLTAASGGGSSVAGAVGAGGLLPQNTETNIGSNWSVVYILQQGELGGGDAKSGGGVVYNEGGTIKAVMEAANHNAKTVNPVSATKVCTGAGTSPDSNGFCVRLSGANLLIHMGNDSKGFYTTLK